MTAAFAIRAVLGNSWVLNSGNVQANLDIDFVNNRAWNSGLTTIASLFTCTRASTGYYTNADGTITSFGNNVLRTGTSGLLVEESRTNNAPASMDIGNATYWPQYHGTWTSNTSDTTDPFGTNLATKFAEDSTTNFHLVETANVTGSTSPVTYSVMLKYGTCPYVQVLLRAVGQQITGVFDISSANSAATQTAGIGGATFTSSSQVALTNGWYLCSITGTMTSASSTTLDLATAPAATGNTFGSGGYITFAGTNRYFYCIQAQYEVGPFGTSTVKTTNASSVTRAADNISFGITSPWLVSGTQTIYAQFKTPAASAAANICYFSDGTTNNLKQLLLSSAAKSQALTSGSGSADGSATVAVATTANVLSKAACAIAANDLAIVQDNGTAATDNTVTIPTGLTTAYLGSSTGSSQFTNGYINRFATWSSRLSNGALGTLTT